MDPTYPTIVPEEGLEIFPTEQSFVLLPAAVFGGEELLYSNPLTTVCTRFDILHIRPSTVFRVPHLSPNFFFAFSTLTKVLFQCQPALGSRQGENPCARFTSKLI